MLFTTSYVVHNVLCCSQRCKFLGSGPVQNQCLFVVSGPDVDVTLSNIFSLQYLMWQRLQPVFYCCWIESCLHWTNVVITALCNILSCDLMLLLDQMKVSLPLP